MKRREGACWEEPQKKNVKCDTDERWEEEQQVEEVRLQFISRKC
jgi:hypothetical protein